MQRKEKLSFTTRGHWHLPSLLSAKAFSTQNSKPTLTSRYLLNDIIRDRSRGPRESNASQLSRLI